MTDLDQNIFVAGHHGMVGSAIVRTLQYRGYRHLMTREHKELDLENQSQVTHFFCTQQIDTVYLAAAKVGGILANQTYPVDFLYRNLMIQCNVIHAAFASGVKHLLFLGSSCIYPKFAPQPLKEEALLTSALEPSNEAYAIAKIAGLKLCEAYNRQYGTRYISAMPTNLYGQNDNYDLQNSHVLPALIHKFHQAREQNAPSVPIWGSGKPRREFLYVDDLAKACIMLMESDVASGVYNVGVGKDVSITELAHIVAHTVGYHGELTYDTTKPDGTPQKRLDVSRIHALGWRAEISLTQGIQTTYRHYLKQAAAQLVPLV
jgi:GDP-L-fucose synthase